ncbi:MAG: anthranilate synthase component II [Flavobacteriaceae bacterium]
MDLIYFDKKFALSTHQPKIVLIDANDSFVHNIKDRFFQLGHSLEIIPYAAFDPEAPFTADGVILSPGPGNATAYRKWFHLLENIAPNIPVLGVCLGYQVIAHFYGARLEQLNEVIHGQQHRCIQTAPHPLWKNIPTDFQTGRYHSWAIAMDALPECLLPIAKTADNCLMGIAHKSVPHMGIQFHPESFMCPEGAQIFKNFIALIPWE